MSTPMPRGIERDDTEHGKLYYTRAQLLAYGLDREDAAIRRMQALKPSSQSASTGSATVDDLLSKMSMR